MPRRLDPRRHSLRLPNRDYAAPGLVMVTIDTANRQQLLGEIDVMGIPTPTEVAQSSVGQVVHWFKATTVEAYRQGVLASGWEQYDGKLWHRNFHDRILRKGELDIRRRYIQLNPQRRWEAMQARVEEMSQHPVLQSHDWTGDHTSDPGDS